MPEENNHKLQNEECVELNWKLCSQLQVINETLYRILILQNRCWFGMFCDFNCEYQTVSFLHIFEFRRKVLALACALIVPVMFTEKASSFHTLRVLAQQVLAELFFPVKSLLAVAAHKSVRAFVLSFVIPQSRL